ncbi:hypothetical protein EVAR_8089_1 [Eumeta japonica]|uniref:Uncharacterized protein n=1 Tax=Eumeta variegata TaxID=151549 RepID=A0A4C1TSP7_EUMVA|nr:hypothetical protein EVAR_8089_1 [Eumeta japonica]
MTKKAKKARHAGRLPAFAAGSYLRQLAATRSDNPAPSHAVVQKLLKAPTVLVWAKNGYATVCQMLHARRRPNNPCAAVAMRVVGDRTQTRVRALSDFALTGYKSRALPLERARRASADADPAARRRRRRVLPPRIPGDSFSASAPYCVPGAIALPYALNADRRTSEVRPVRTLRAFDLKPSTLAHGGLRAVNDHRSPTRR